MKSETPEPETIDDYIVQADPSVRERLEAVRTTIRNAAPAATEAIKYRLPTFVVGRNLVHFGAFKHHVGFYPTSSGIAAFEQELKGYASSKGAVQFPHDRPLPLDLIRRIVKFRVAEENARTKTRKKPKP